MRPLCPWKVPLLVLVSVAILSAAGTQDAPMLEPGEDQPGGAATTRHAANRDVFSQSSANLSAVHKMDFLVGNGLFRRAWVSAPASTQSGDGLGPLYNARSCQGCHIKDGRGHPLDPAAQDYDAVSMLLKLSIPPQSDADRAALASGRAATIPEPTYGGQLQDIAIQGIVAEGRIRIEYSESPVSLAGGGTASLRAPRYTVTHLGYGPLHPQVMLSPRIAPQMIGLGLLEAIPEADLLALADPEDRNGDGISGRPNRVWSDSQQRMMLGRFGWKAGQPTVLDQSAHAFNADIGMSTPLLPRGEGDCTPQQTQCLAAPNGNSRQRDGAEISTQMLELVTFYSQTVAVPQRRNAASPDVAAGKRIFHQTGCAVCHVPSFVTGKETAVPELAGQRIWPYTDLLLHDMGPGLADGRPEAQAGGSEWRTPPLWGIGLTETVNDHTFFLHDGRARNLLEAILWHGGEAERSRKAVEALSPEDRDRLLAFLNSL